MDIATIVGLVMGFVLILMSIILGGVGLGIYINVPSILMVLGGSFGAVLVSNPLGRVLGMGKYLGHVIRTPTYEVEKTITTIHNFSDRARKEGILSLEEDIEELENEFLKKGIQLVVDGTDPQMIEKVLYNELGQIQERHAVGIKLFEDWGKLAPAFGMIGTLVGLIAMLANLQDQDAIGSGMAIALITTLYGAIFANLVLIPIKNKLEDRDREEMLLRDVVVEGVLSIQAGDNPQILAQKLIAFLEPPRRRGLEEELNLNK